MRSRSGFRGKSAGGLAILAALSVGVADAADAPPGERWKTTSSMEMMGMKMPGQTTFVCLEPGSNDVPVGHDKNCTTHDVRRTANGMTFRMSCTGKEAYEAEGEVTSLGPNRSRTTLLMRTADGEMTMISENEKMGACTGSEANLVAKRMIAKAETDSRKIQAEQERMRAQQCADAARTGDFYTVNSGLCRNDKAAVKTFCANFQTHTVFRKIAEEQARNVRSGASAGGQVQPLTSSASLCGVDADKTRDRLCGTAEAQGQYAFIATQCLTLAGAIGKRECSGRAGTYHASDPRYLPICAALAGKAVEDAASPDDQTSAPGNATPAAEVPTQEKKKPGLFNKGKKALDGLFGN